MINSPGNYYSILPKEMTKKQFVIEFFLKRINAEDHINSELEIKDAIEIYDMIEKECAE